MNCTVSGRQPGKSVERQCHVLPEGHRSQEGVGLEKDADSSPDPVEFIVIGGGDIHPRRQAPVPAAGRMRPIMCLRSVDFPQPLPPTMQRISPRNTSRLTFSRIVVFAETRRQTLHDDDRCTRRFFPSVCVRFRFYTLLIHIVENDGKHRIHDHDQQDRRDHCRCRCRAHLLHSAPTWNPR